MSTPLSLPDPPASDDLQRLSLRYLPQLMPILWEMGRMVDLRAVAQESLSGDLVNATDEVRDAAFHSFELVTKLAELDEWLVAETDKMRARKEGEA